MEQTDEYEIQMIYKYVSIAQIEEVKKSINSLANCKKKI